MILLPRERNVRRNGCDLKRETLIGVTVKTLMTTAAATTTMLSATPLGIVHRVVLSTI